MIPAFFVAYVATLHTACLRAIGVPPIRPFARAYVSSHIRHALVYVDYKICPTVQI